MFRQLPDCAIPGYAPICVDTNDPDTIMAGMLKRVMRALPTPDHRLLNEFREFVREQVSHLPKARDLGFIEWLALTSYSQSRKDELTRVFNDLRGGRPTMKQCRRIMSFVKSEAYAEYKHARLINSRCDAFKVFSGPRFRAVEEVVYAMPEFIKHVPVPERPARIRAMDHPHTMVYSTDFTAFESHFTPVIIDICEGELYRHCLSWTKDVGLLIATLGGPNRMRTRSGTSAMVHGRRMSGDTCTSLGNGFTNLMLARFVASRSNAQLEALVEGDDGLFVTDKPLNIRLYEQLGWTIKVERWATVFEASFCGMLVSPDGELIREPAHFLQTFGWTSSFVNGGVPLMKELLRAKALSACYEMPECPIVGALARRGLAVTQGCHPKFVTDGYHVVPTDEVNVRPFAPSPVTREFFAKRFGIDADVQVAVESAILCGDLRQVSALLPPSAHNLHFWARYIEAG